MVFIDIAKIDMKRGENVSEILLDLDVKQCLTEMSDKNV